MTRSPPLARTSLRPKSSDARLTKSGLWLILSGPVVSPAAVTDVYAFGYRISLPTDLSLPVLRSAVRLFCSLGV